MSKKKEAQTSTNLFVSILRTLYDYIQVLSLDVVIGSVLISYTFTNISGGAVDFHYYYFLGISVWLVYTIDHLIDAYKIKGKAITFRHRFHQNYFKLLSGIWLIVFLVGLIFSLLILPEQVIQAGLFVAALAVAHLILVVFLWTKISKFIQKEVGVGIGYTLGVLLLPYLYGNDLSLYFYLASLELFLLVMLNIYLFSFFDQEKDKLQGQSSIIHNVGNSNVLLLLNFLFSVTTILIVITTFIYSEYMQFQFLFILMILALYSLYYCNSYFKQNDRYRILGDGIFLFPLLLLIYEWI